MKETTINIFLAIAFLFGAYVVDDLMTWYRVYPDESTKLFLTGLMHIKDVQGFGYTVVFFVQVFIAVFPFSIGLMLRKMNITKTR